ncbi:MULTISPECIES: mechanosensitive ion channel family protein [Ramlibacter]|uniref:Mechanosensitive ion channel n=1 Tax=Ramlibacter pinisoli TaxID=2682844 RepID=A0A6N8IYR2_9BURK|nr:MULTISPECIES: mechanosensitive ion channel family protein [Ramlibacter]MBA2962219.1 mechanosensitive ion channel family protein [Ramlibacter sp. CGMCC 1.13660]MVQ32161.1 mechanosensitive ion channel [Ramlibacter pinisoli]
MARPLHRPMAWAAVWSRLAGLVLAAWLALLPWGAIGQIPGTRPAPSQPAEAQQARDPLGRETPRGSFTRFSSAANSGNFGLGARYLQLSAAQRDKGELLARQLGELTDRYFLVPLSTISDRPEGRINDGLPIDRDRVGPMRIGGDEFYLELVRVQDPEGRLVWLVSSQTLARVPQLHADMDRSWAERVLPDALSHTVVLGAPLPQLVIWAASLALPLLVVPALLWALRALTRGLARKRSPLWAQWYVAARWPLAVVLVLLLHTAALPAFGSSLAFRVIYVRVIAALLVAALAWTLHRSARVLFERASARLLQEGRSGPRSLLLLGERLFMALLLVAAVLGMLAVAGVQVTAALAGLGIAGIAVALGAQKTVENILGGLMLLADQAIAVGDTCRIGAHMGVVEDITLRSVRIRTFEQTLLSIPAGVLAQDTLENFASRGKILLQTSVRLAYGPTEHELRTLLEELRGLLAGHPRIDPTGARVRLAGFGVQGIEVELFAYFQTADGLEFLALREELLLQVMRVVQARGAVFAPAWTVPGAAAAGATG